MAIQINLDQNLSTSPRLTIHILPAGNSAVACGMLHGHAWPQRNLLYIYIYSRYIYIYTLYIYIYIYLHIYIYTLWLCQNSYWKWPFIDGLPITNGGSFQFAMLVYQRVYTQPWLKNEDLSPWWDGLFGGRFSEIHQRMFSVTLGFMKKNEKWKTDGAPSNMIYKCWVFHISVK